MGIIVEINQSRTENVVGWSPWTSISV